MKHPIRILHLEDDPADRELTRANLEAAGLKYRITDVQTGVEYDEALRQDGYDVILADFRLPMYDGMSALRLAQELCPDVPFIFVSGTMGEDAAIEGLTKGATDYVLKQKLSRLVPAIKRALTEAENHRERQCAEKTLFQANERWGKTFDAVPDLIAILDRDFRIVQANKAMAGRLGLTPEACTGQLCHKLCHKTEAPPSFCPNVQTLTDGKEHMVEVREERLGGDFIVSTSPMFDSQGQMIGAVHVARDITDRKRSEHHIHKLNRIYAVLSNINQTIVRIHDCKQLLNEVCRITIEDGLFRMAWIGFVDTQTNKIDVVASFGVTGDCLEKINIDLNDELQSNGPAGIAVKTGKYKISNNIMHDDNMLPWRDNALKYNYKSAAFFPLIVFDKIIGVFLIYSNETDFFDEKDINLLNEIAMDISFALESMENETERRQTEENLIKAKEKAEESDRLKTAFLNNVSHEIRTPMNAIMGFSELLAESYNDKHIIEKFTKIINQRCEDLLVIIDGILDIAKIESGLCPINIEKFTINELFAELTFFFSEYQKRIGKHEIKFSLHALRNPAENIITSDKVKLKQILINLLNNAFKFTEKGKIEGGCERNDNKLVFYVSDTGIGISADKHNKIFERFYQIPIVGNHKINEGNGLGLAIVKGFVELIGGKIWLESEPGRGTTFFFSIPCKMSEEIQHESLVNDIPEVYHFGNKIILVVEDDPYNAEHIKEILSKIGLKILHTVNGSEAIRIASSQKPDLVLMDIRLPDMDGYEATQKIKQHSPDLKIIAQTAYATQDDKQRAFDAGCIDYISKPLRRDLLLSIIMKHLR